MFTIRNYSLQKSFASFWLAIIDITSLIIAPLMDGCYEKISSRKELLYRMSHLILAAFTFAFCVLDYRLVSSHKPYINIRILKLGKIGFHLIPHLKEISGIMLFISLQSATVACISIFFVLPVTSNLDIIV